jgi:hypothetical protein
MKTTTTWKMLAIIIWLSCSIRTNAQNFNCYITNDHLVSPTEYRFDVMIEATSVPFDFRTFQMGVQFSSAFIPAGANVSGSYINNTTQMHSYTPLNTPQWNATFNCLSVPANGVLVNGCIDSTNLTPGHAAKRIGTYRLISDLPFNCAPPNISMIRPTDTPPHVSILKCAVTKWSTCLAVTISGNGIYTHFSPNTLYGGVVNLNEISANSVAPVIASACPGNGTVSFTVSATGNGSSTPLSFQWLLNGVTITDNALYSGTTTPTLTITNATTGGSFTCQVSQCSPTTSVVFSPPATLSITVTDDGNACTTDVCDAGSGNATHSVINPDDNNLCTADGCDPANGVYHTPVNASDNNLCTNDYCDPQSGVHNDPLPTINDNSVCTTDACDPATGTISHTPISVDDHNPCTADGCDPVNGPTHTPNNYTDANLCDVESCDPLTGFISHTPVSTTDNNPCTNDACNPSTGNISHTPVTVTDGNACTLDACDPATGQINHTDNTPVITATAGVILCNGGSTNVTVSAIGGMPPYVGDDVISFGAGTHPIAVTDNNGCTAETTIVISQPTKLTVTATSTQTSCSTANGTATANPVDGTPGYSYSWLPGGQTTQTAVGLANNLYTATVTDANGCTATASVNVTIAGGGPASPGPISGSALVCRGQCIVYSIAPVAGATSYLWTLPKGANGSSTTNSITVCFNSKFDGGFICVTSNGSCGASSSSCLNVIKVSSYPATPTAIFGPSNICRNSTAVFSISAVPLATSYTWTVGSGLSIISGQGTTTVTVAASSSFTSGTLKVIAKNCKGNSGAKSKSLQNGLPGTPGSISGVATVCKSQSSVAFSTGAVMSATSYTWTVTGGASIASGQGTPSITVNFTTSTGNAILSVKANGLCGSSPVKTKSITVTLNCRLSGSAEVEVNESDLTSMTAYPNPTSHFTTIRFNSLMGSTGVIRVSDILGQTLQSHSLAITEGLNAKELDLSSLSKGIYLITISDGDYEKTLRIIVE